MAGPYTRHNDGETLSAAEVNTLQEGIEEHETRLDALEVIDHAAVTVSDTATVNLTLADQALSADVIPGGISHAGLADVGTNTHAQIDTHVAATAAHGATGAVVGTTNTQTLTNKTLTSPAITTPTGIVKGDVGLGNVDNTSDAAKPVSTATQTALDAKQAADAFLDDIAALTDPGADRILFWDDSAGDITWLAAGANLTITGTSIAAAGGGGGTTEASLARSFLFMGA
jgi:hypothetical protein